VNDDGLPAETGSPVSEDVKQRGIDFLQGLLASGKVDLDRFQNALDALLEVRTQDDFASVVRGLPSPVEFTPPARQRQEPLEISTSMGDVRLEGRWQVSRLTKIDTGMGNVTIDLSQAEFDDWDVKIVVRTGMGTVTVIVPRGLEVRPVGRSGPVTSTLEPPIPGFPVVRLSATSNMGAIRVKHPTEKKQRRQRWRRRRGKDLPRPRSTHYWGRPSSAGVARRQVSEIVLVVCGPLGELCQRAVREGLAYRGQLVDGAATLAGRFAVRCSHDHVAR
jgi:hypothetical protein